MLDFPKWKIGFILLVALAGIWFALPNFYQIDDSAKKLNLGLDLRGGSHLLLEVDFEGYITTQYENLVDDVRKTLRADKLGYKDLTSDENGVNFRVRKPEDLEKAKKVIIDSSPNYEVHNEGDVVTVFFKDAVVTRKKIELVNQSIEIIRRRVDEDGTKEPIIQKQGEDRIVLQVPGAEDPEEIKNKINKTARLTFHMVKGDDPVRADAVPSPGHIILQDLDGDFYEIEKREKLGGENLDYASQSYDQFSNVSVSFKFDSIGGRKFGDLTKDNVGRRFASVLDGQIISAPAIREPILGGVGQITGNFSVEEANDLATLLRAGALPAELRILEERTVGASLGADSIAAGKSASIIAVALVAVFMVLSYGFFGVVSVMSLFLNLIMVMGALSLFQATLTLPGIAGIVLTVGMAVDANVLIFERIREEIKFGAKPMAAIDNGFSKAFSTILDSNITTLIVAILLFSFGSGPVKGFAVTLCIGILCSMFTAIMFSRMVISIWIKRKRPQSIKL